MPFIMNFSELLDNKTFKPKEKTELLSKWLLENPQEIETYIHFAGTQKDVVKATCIEAIEFATKTNPGIATLNCLDFISDTLAAKSPRIKWESARVIGNIAQLFPGNLDKAIGNLLLNAEHPGTVVRWSAAFALGQILKIRLALNNELIPTIERICVQEEKNSIRKIYLDALKKVKK